MKDAVKNRGLGLIRRSRGRPRRSFPEWARLDEDQKPLVAGLHRMMGVERALDGAGMSGDTDMTFLGPVGPLFFDLFATLQSNHRSFFVGTENQP